MANSKTIEEIDEAREKEDMKKLEAVFFICGRFLNMQELISLTDLNPIILQELIEKLQDKYDEADSAVEIIKKGEGTGRVWKMDVRAQYHGIINKVAGGRSEFSKAEQETLGIIAFKQPIKQSVIIKIRGNKGYEHIKKFADLGLIKKKKVGHTAELSLADDFYDYFTLQEEQDRLPQELLKEKGPENNLNISEEE